MAKKALSINRFDAGIVEGPNPRDIANEASVTLEGLDPTTIGALRPIGNIGSSTYPPLASIRGYLPGKRGYGLFQFSTDFDGLHKHMSVKLADGILPDGYQFNTDWTQTKQDSSKSVLYTLLCLNRYEHDELLNAAANIPYPNVGEFNVYVHRYLFEFPDDEENGWYQLGRELTCPEATVSGQGASAYNPTAPLHTFNFNHNFTEFEDLERWPLSTDAAGNTVTPNQPYLPKFYTIAGFPRMYDANKVNPSYFFGYAKR